MRNRPDSTVPSITQFCPEILRRLVCHRVERNDGLPVGRQEKFSEAGIDGVTEAKRPGASMGRQAGMLATRGQ